MGNRIDILEKVVLKSGYKLEIEASYDCWMKKRKFIVSCGCAYGKGLSLNEAIDNCIEDAKDLGYYE